MPTTNEYETDYEPVSQMAFIRPRRPAKETVLAISPNIQLDVSSLNPLPSPLLRWSTGATKIQDQRPCIYLPLVKVWKTFPHHLNDTKRLKGLYSKQVLQFAFADTVSHLKAGLRSL